MWNMKIFLFLVTIVVSVSISFSGSTTLQYHDETLSPQLENDTDNVHSFQLFSSDHTYFMSLGVGSPAKKVNLSLDTGSDIVWLQCSPCNKCYKQPGPIFRPRNSSTFSQVGCEDPRCKQLHYYSDGCGGKHNNTCLYNATYSDLSFSQGAFSTETLTLGNTTKLNKIAFGCGHDNEGWITESAGLLGLSRGNLSFITQTADQFQRQFSYCLAVPSPNISRNSTIVFGPSVVTTQNAVYTPLIYTNTSLYYVNLTGISVNGTLVPGINSSVSDLKPDGDAGGVIIDSGTAYTRLVNDTYVALRNAFRAAMNSTLGSPMNYSWFDTCYRISSDLEVPTVKLHFDKGATMTLGPDNTMTEMDIDETAATLCFAFMSDKWYNTIGNIQQQGIRIVYDLPANRIGFAADSC